MQQEHWRARIIYMVKRANEGHPRNLDLLAERLADLDFAVDALIDAGFGQPGDDIREIVANIIEATPTIATEEVVDGETAAAVS